METFSVNELAERVRSAAQSCGIGVSIESIENPRKEKEEHDYNVKNTALLSLGLKPNFMTEAVLGNMLERIGAHKALIDRQMPDPDIEDVAAYLAAIELPTRLAPIDENAPGFDALVRLEEAKRVLQIPRAEGDVEAGERLYRRECASCHGKDGRGDVQQAVPMLAGQYTSYLWRQVDKYKAGIRIHDPDAPEDRLLAEFSRDELRDIFAHVSVLDD